MDIESFYDEQLDESLDVDFSNLLSLKEKEIKVTAKAVKHKLKPKRVKTERQIPDDEFDILESSMSNMSSLTEIVMDVCRTEVEGFSGTYIYIPRVACMSCRCRRPARIHEKFYKLVSPYGKYRMTPAQAFELIEGSDPGAPKLRLCCKKTVMNPIQQSTLASAYDPMLISGRKSVRSVSRDVPYPLEEECIMSDSKKQYINALVSGSLTDPNYYQPIVYKDVSQYKIEYHNKMPVVWSKDWANEASSLKKLKEWMEVAENRGVSIDEYQIALGKMLNGEKSIDVWEVNEMIKEIAALTGEEYGEEPEYEDAGCYTGVIKKVQYSQNLFGDVYVSTCDLKKARSFFGQDEEFEDDDEI